MYLRLKKSKLINSLSQVGINLLCFLPLLAIGLQAQDVEAKRTMERSLYGIVDNEIPTPGISLPLGKKDPSAVGVIQNFLKSTNLAGWTGLEANGQFTFTGLEPDKQLQAKLSLGHGNLFRLDVSLANGSESIRIHGRIGKVQEGDGSFHTLSFAAAKGGIFVFPLLADLKPDSPDLSILDRGVIVVEGVNLRRITIEETIHEGQSAVKRDQVVAVDLYFDPNTQLLLKSSMSERLASTDANKYLQVITYSNYQNVSGVLVPYSYSESLNGQPQWSLQLSTAELHAYADKNYFLF